MLGFEGACSRSRQVENQPILTGMLRPSLPAALDAIDLGPLGPLPPEALLLDPGSVLELAAGANAAAMR
jgi:hypothetical protein